SAHPPARGGRTPHGVSRRRRSLLRHRPAALLDPLHRGPCPLEPRRLAQARGHARLPGCLAQDVCRMADPFSPSPKENPMSPTLLQLMAALPESEERPDDPEIPAEFVHAF